MSSSHETFVKEKNIAGVCGGGYRRISVQWLGLSRASDPPPLFLCFCFCFSFFFDVKPAYETVPATMGAPKPEEKNTPSRYSVFLFLGEDSQSHSCAGGEKTAVKRAREAGVLHDRDAPLFFLLVFFAGNNPRFLGTFLRPLSSKAKKKR